MFCCHDSWLWEVFILHPTHLLLLFHLARCCGEQVLFQSLMREEFKVDKTFSLSPAAHRRSCHGLVYTVFFHHKFQMPRSPTMNSQNSHFRINTQNHHKDEACLSHSPNLSVLISPSAPGLQQLPCTPCFQGCAEEAIDLEIRCVQGHGAIFPTLPRWPGWVCKGSDSQYLSSWETERHFGVFRCQ